MTELNINVNKLYEPTTVYELVNPYSMLERIVVPDNRSNASKHGFNPKEVSKRRKRNKNKKMHRNKIRRNIMSRPNRKHKISTGVVRVLSRMKYLERIGRNPYNASEPTPKYSKYWDTLHDKKKKRDCMGHRLNRKPPF